ncbi:autotransporter domain-containing protein [Croceimicrobium hydrocarbonivorans]|uniref:Outer membrane beta-barrel protein n=1 Tax=Croceimicrobium hydrocarbonivorans TaxID=2761580 RepID=A0A7H0VDI5_9FLAO|nr:autotransporter domain-containing protein [Croceimicrobium hydrocarbonivorans]QNR23783.1 outer membrane beta-barrel protein [Croceimicrobium hydrocarbonivorans]
MKNTFLKILGLVCLSTYLLQAQNMVNYNLNGMVVQGEASGGSVVSDDIALGFGLGYDFPFANPRFEFAVKLDYLWINLDYIADENPTNISIMRGTMNQFSASGGLNIYLNNSHNVANLYQPFRPYMQILTGIIAQSNSLETSGNFNFPSVDGFLILPVVELGGGAKVRINPQWSLNFNIGFRTTFSDDIDGLIGSTASPDIMGILRMGVSKRL